MKRLALAILLAVSPSCASALAQGAGVAIASRAPGRITLHNQVIEADVTLQHGLPRIVQVVSSTSHAILALPGLFTLTDRSGPVLTSAGMVAAGPPRLQHVPASQHASRLADRFPALRVSWPLRSRDGSLQARWSLVLGDDATYIRTVLTLTAIRRNVPLSNVQLLAFTAPTARVVGSVKGSPIVAEPFFAGFEHPLSTSAVNSTGEATVFITRTLPLRAGQSVTYSAVIGIVRPGQLRRDFLTYLERERAHPYRTFLHYNTWYDLGRFNPYTEAGALDRINAIGQHLHVERNVTLDSFLFDDGWDDHSSLWNFEPTNFPRGFSAVRSATEKYGAEPGVWMSPWGGYSKPKQDRLAYGRQQGFEIVNDGFALSGPAYYARFRDVCLRMIRDYGVNQFKFDGTGNADTVFPGSQFDSDFDAALHLIALLRQQKPDIFINLTTGTYPSPFWLLSADSIWRGGEDDDVAGEGPYRERWITYRDADTFQRVVQAGPLYPLNSLMLHGIIYAERHKQLSQDLTGAFRHEVRSYFGTGTQLQELYITPALLSSQNWDDLAEAARWSRANASVLVDTHWIGGDPAKAQVYGWASWSPRKSILVLRNPSPNPQAITIDLQSALELPPTAAQNFSAHSPWKDDANQPAILLQAGTPHTFSLQPFQVLTLDLTPR